VHAVLHELTCNVTRSRPTGTFNESLTKIVRGNTSLFKQRQVFKPREGNEKTRKGKSEKDMRTKRAKARQERRQRIDDANDGDDDEVNTSVPVP